MTPDGSLRVLVGVMTLAHLAFAGARVGLSLFALELKVSTFGVGIVMSLLALVPMLLAVHTGRWIDRVGIVKPVQIGLTTMVVGALLPWLLPAAATLYLAAVLLGTGFMLAHVAINNAVGHASTPENRMRSYTLLALGFSTSSVLGPVLTGITIDSVGHAAAFALLALFPLGTTLLQPALRKVVAALPQESRAPPPDDAHVLDLLREKSLRAIFFTTALLSMAFDMFLFMTPVHGARIGLSASAIGLLIGTLGMATFVVRLALPWIARHLTEWQMLTVALAIAAAVYLLFPLFSALAALALLTFVLGLGLGATQPTVMSLIHHTAPPGRTGEALGVRTVMVNASQTALPLLVGGLGSALGVVPAFWSLALLLAVGSVFTHRRQRAA